MDKRAEIVAVARSIVGPTPTPFHHQASVKGVGCDCIGVLRIVGEECRLPDAVDFARAMLQEFAGYGRDPNPELLEMGCDRYLDRIELPDVRAGDILRFRMPKSFGLPKHFGIVTGVNPLYMVHSWAGGVGRVVENRVDRVWASRINACFRFRGLG